MSDLLRNAYVALVAAHEEVPDFPEWLTQLVAVVATKVGGVDRLIAGRPGSWEAARIRDWIESAAGDSAEYRRIVEELDTEASTVGPGQEKPLSTNDITPLVDAVKEHAQQHYDDGGWDVIVECWEDEQIAECLRRDGATTPESAIAIFASLADVWADRQADARNSAF